MVKQTQPKHWYLASVTVSFVHPGDEEAGIPPMQGSRTVNVLATPNRKKITAQEIHNIRQLSVLRLQEDKLDPNMVSDVVINNIMYLGLMSEVDYFEEFEANKKN